MRQSIARTVHLVTAHGKWEPPYPGREPAGSERQTRCGKPAARRNVTIERGFADCGACIASLPAPGSIAGEVRR